MMLHRTFPSNAVMTMGLELLTSESGDACVVGELVLLLGDIVRVNF